MGNTWDDTVIPFLIALPVAFQLFNIAGFVWWVKKKRSAFRKALVDKCTALNAHFTGRGVNFVMKQSNNGNINADKLIIEVAGRAAAAGTLAPVPQYVVVEKLPQNAVPMQEYLYPGQATEAE